MPTLPKASTEFNFFTNTFFFDILFDAIDSTSVSTTGKPSGIADTDNAITKKNISRGVYPLK